MQVFSAKEKPLQLTLRLQAIPHSMIGLSEWTFFSLMPAVLSSPGQIQAPVATDPKLSKTSSPSKKEEFGPLNHMDHHPTSNF